MSEERIKELIEEVQEFITNLTEEIENEEDFDLFMKMLKANL